MNWNDLKLFLAVADSRSLNGAAQDLGVSNTTVFRHLNAFEEEIGTRLFDRIKGGYKLTEMGEEMLLLAQGISNSFDDIDRHIIGKDMQPKGVVRLTAPVSFAHRFLPQYLYEFKKLHPEIHVELLVTNQETNMNNRNADIAIRVAVSPPDHLVGRKVQTIEWGVYAGKTYMREFGVPSDLDSLKNHKLIGATGDLSFKPAFSWLDTYHSENIQQRSDDLITMSHIANVGHGLAFLPEDVNLVGLQHCFTYEPGGENSLWILTHPDLRKVERIKIVMNYLANRLATDARLSCSRSKK